MTYFKSPLLKGVQKINEKSTETNNICERSVTVGSSADAKLIVLPSLRVNGVGLRLYFLLPLTGSTLKATFAVKKAGYINVGSKLHFSRPVVLDVTLVYPQ